MKFQISVWALRGLYIGIPGILKPPSYIIQCHLDSSRHRFFKDRVNWFLYLLARVL